MRTISPFLVMLFLCLSQSLSASTVSATAVSTGAQLLDINAANALQLAEQLPGIGPSKAAAILQWREQNGHFERIEQLQEVKGIGPKTVEKLRPLIRIGTEAEASQTRLEYNERERKVEADIHRIVDAVELAARPESIQAIPRRKWYQRSVGEMLSTQ